MAYLVDTSVLVRLANTADPFHVIATQAVLELHRRGEVLHVTSQNLVEFRNVATRPISVNGLGLSVADTEAKATIWEATFPLLVETSDIYPAWKASWVGWESSESRSTTHVSSPPATSMR